jgi:hypothetical protein
MEQTTAKMFKMGDLKLYDPGVLEERYGEPSIDPLFAEFPHSAVRFLKTLS